MKAIIKRKRGSQSSQNLRFTMLSAGHIRLSILILQVITSIFYVSLSGCKKFVDIGPPKTTLVSTNVFTNDVTATAALTSIYSQIINDSRIPYFVSLVSGLSGDELTNYSTFPELIPFYTNSLSSTNGIVQSNLWNPFYNYIYQANAAIEGLKSSSGVSSKVKNQLLGEAKFIRAFCNFYLVSFFGQVAIVNTTDYKINAVTPISTYSQVCQQIINDLKEAQALLNNNYVDASSIMATTDRIRPNKWAATALLAKAYLYSTDYVNAELQATAVINESSLFTLEAVNNVFNKNNTEAIWQIKPVYPNSNTPEGANYILVGPPQSNVSNCTTLSEQLLNAFEPGDLRQTNWISNYSGYYFPNKYKADASVSGTVEYSVVLRLAEQYLIRAEARIQQNHLAAAATDINKVRNRAGLPNTTATTQSQLFTALFHERQVELFTEWGNRWFDLKRSNAVDSVMNVVSKSKGGAWSPYKSLYPIPQTDILNDPNLTQNVGY